MSTTPELHPWSMTISISLLDVCHYSSGDSYSDVHLSDILQVDHLLKEHTAHRVTGTLCFMAGPLYATPIRTYSEPGIAERKRLAPQRGSWVWQPGRCQNAASFHFALCLRESLLPKEGMDIRCFPLIRKSECKHVLLICIGLGPERSSRRCRCRKPRAYYRP